MIHRAFAFLREWLWPEIDPPVVVWRVDREGNVYLPERRVVLKSSRKDGKNEE